MKSMRVVIGPLRPAALLLPALLPAWLAACSSESPPPPSPRPIPGGTLRILNEVPRDLDPVFADDVYEGTIINQVYEGLVRVNGNLGLVPSLARSWVVSEDGLRYRFELRPGVRFHNGDLLDADVVVRSLSRTLCPDRPGDCLAESYLEQIAGAAEFREGKAKEIRGLRALDSGTVEIELNEPLSFFLSVLSMDQTRIVPAKSVRSWTDLEERPIGTGPFRFGERLADGTVILERNPDYWGQPAMLDSLIFVCQPAPETGDETLLLLLKGNVDVASILPQDRDLVERKLGLRLTSTPELALTFLGVNTTLPPLDRLEVRQAIAHCVNRQGFLRSAEQDVLPAQGILPPGMPGYLPEAKVLSFDLAEAARLMRSVGYSPENPTPEVLLSTSSTGPTKTWLETEFAHRLAEIGIPLRVEVLPWPELDRKISERRAPLFTLAWITDVPDPDGFFYPLFYSGDSHNLFDLSDPKVDSLLTRARSLPPGSERFAAYRAVEKRVLETVPMIPLYHERVLYAWNPRVQGVEISPFGFSLIPFAKVWLGTEEPGTGGLAGGTVR